MSVVDVAVFALWGLAWCGFLALGQLIVGWMDRKGYWDDDFHLSEPRSHVKVLDREETR